MTDDSDDRNKETPKEPPKEPPPPEDVNVTIARDSDPKGTKKK